MDAALQSLRNTVEFESLYVWQFIKSRDKKFHIKLVSGLMLLIFVIIILAASLPSSKSSRSNIQKQEFSKLLTITGEPVQTPESQIIDLENPRLNCSHGGYAPLEIWAATGGLLKGNLPVFCGGHSKVDSSWSNRCFIAGKTDILVSLSEARIDPASIVMDDGRLWITGGYNGDYRIKSTEFVSVDPISVEKGPDLPNNVTLHGLVKVDSTTAMLIGGYDNRERAIADVYSFDFTTQLWTSGPSLLVPIDQAACGTLIDAKTGKTVVIAAGGETANDRKIKTTQMFVPGSNEWIYGPVLPVELVQASGLSYKNDFYVVGGLIDGGGAVKTIYKLTCSNLQCHWTVMDQELEVARYETVVIPIPDNMTTCEET